LRMMNWWKLPLKVFAYAKKYLIQIFVKERKKEGKIKG